MHIFFGNTKGLARCENPDSSATHWSFSCDWRCL